MKIAFASGKGGTGKTTLATNLAAVLAGAVEPVSYVDADVEEPNGHIFLKPEIEEVIDVKVPVPELDYAKCTLCGDCVGFCQYHALALISDKIMVFPSLCHSCGACRELCPEKAIRETPRTIGTIEKGQYRGKRFFAGHLNVGEALSPPLTRTLKSILPGDGLTIIDAPPGTSCPVVEAVQGCDFVVLVTEPTPFGLSDLGLAYGLTRRLNIPCGVVINRSDIGNGEARRFIEEKHMAILMDIPYRRNTAETYSRGGLMVDEDRDFARTIHHMYGMIRQVL